MVGLLISIVMNGLKQTYHLWMAIITLDIINNLHCKEYHYIDPRRKSNYKTIGFIAQQIQDSLPSAVNMNDIFS